MTEAMLKRILDEAQAKKGAGGEQELGEGRRITLYAAHAGVPLTVSKVVALRVTEGTMHARNDKGERFFLALEDVFAAGVEGGTAAAALSRKAGFVGQ